MPDLKFGHKVTVINPADGFARANVDTTTYGIQLLVFALRSYEPEPWEASLHRVLLSELEGASQWVG